MKNSIEKLIHNWSTNMVRLSCLVVILLGTSEYLMHTTDVNEIEIEDMEYTADQQVEFPLPVLKKAFTW